MFINAQPVDVRSTACTLPWTTPSQMLAGTSGDYISRIVGDVKKQLESDKSNSFGFPQITASDVWTAVASRDRSDSASCVNSVVLPATAAAGEDSPPDPWQSSHVPPGTFNPSVLFPDPSTATFDIEGWKGDYVARMGYIRTHMETQVAAAKVRGRWRSEEVARAATSVQVCG
jgi:hypothetical protein